METPGRPRRPWGFAVAWAVATALAVAVGLLAIDLVGASVRGRGPLGTDVAPAGDAREGIGAVDPGARAVRRSVDGEWGAFVVECRGVYAFGRSAQPDRTEGWRVVSYERGPDDDVDAVFASGRRSVDLEVFCNRGRPTVAEIERNTLPGGAG